ncbi:MAG: hypothetical protein KQJ78_18475 [Deltaproteobacteria bacterium]|nr:hypothetical protein [Deltaproteobacteria bacterium]
MPEVEAVKGKKVALEVGPQDAQELKASGKEFISALVGKRMQAQDNIMFGNMLLRVESTKPKGVVFIDRNTTVKISIAKEPPRVNCPACEQEQSSAATACDACGAPLPVVEI